MAIEPALTAEEWKLQRFEPLSEPALIVHDDGDGIEFVTRNDAGELLGKYKLEHWQPGDHAGVIALLNHGLPDADPRKITREWVTFLRDLAAVCEMESGDDWKEDGPKLRAIADALASYLPPEGA